MNRNFQRILFALFFPLLPSLFYAQNLQSVKPNDFEADQTSSFAFVSYHDFIMAVKEIEAFPAYQTEDKGRIRETTTRLRVHSYGPHASLPPGGALEDAEAFLNIQKAGFAFNLATPNSPYYEVEEGNCILPKSVPPLSNILGEVGASSGIPVCQERYLNATSPTPNLILAQNYLTARGYENGYHDNPSALLIDNFGLQVDIGHLLFNLDCLLNGNTPAPGFRNRYGIQEGTDLAGFVADHALALGEYRYHLFTGKLPNKKPYNPRTADRDRYLEINVSLADVLGDIDAIGLYKVSQQNPTLPLSEVLNHYYDTSSTAGFLSVKNRWLIFAEHMHFVYWNATTSSWHWDLSRSPYDAQSPYFNMTVEEVFREKVTRVAIFWSLKCDSGWRTALIVLNTLNVPSKNAFSNLPNDDGDLLWVCAKALDLVQTNLLAEQKNSVVIQ